MKEFVRETMEHPLLFILLLIAMGFIGAACELVHIEDKNK